MKLLYKSLSPFTLGGTEYSAEVKTDGNTLTLWLSVPSGTRQYHSGDITYNGTTYTYRFFSPGSFTFYFDYSENVKTFTISENGSDKVCSWVGSYSDPAPDVSISYTGIRSGSYFTAYFSYAGTSQNNALVAPKIYFYNSDGWNMLGYTPQKNTGSQHSSYIFTGNPPGTIYKVVLLFACYSSPSDELEDYIGLTEYELPLFLSAGEDEPFTPQNLTYSPQKTGKPFSVSWNRVNDPDYPVDRYILMRSINNAAYTEVYEGEENSYTDTLPSGTRRVSYRIRSASGENYSIFSEGETVPVISSNIYVGLNGVPKRADSVFIGQNGIPKDADTNAHIG